MLRCVFGSEFADTRTFKNELVELRPGSDLPPPGRAESPFVASEFLFPVHVPGRQSERFLNCPPICRCQRKRQLASVVTVFIRDKL